MFSIHDSGMRVASGSISSGHSPCFCALHTDTAGEWARASAAARANAEEGTVSSDAAASVGDELRDVMGAGG